MQSRTPTAASAELSYSSALLPRVVSVSRVDCISNLAGHSRAASCMYGPPLRTLLVSIACKRLEFLLSAVPPELGRTLVRTTAQRRKWLPVRQSLDAPPRACDEWRGQQCPSVGCAFVAPRTAEGAGEWALADEGSVPVLRFCSRRATLGRRVPSMDSIGSAPLPTSPTVAPVQMWPGVGPCLAQRRDLHSALQLEPFELRPVDRPIGRLLA